MRHEKTKLSAGQSLRQTQAGSMPSEPHA